MLSKSASDSLFIVGTRCTRVKNPGEGVAQIFAKNPGGQVFQEKLPGRSPYFGYYCIFINKSFEIRLWGLKFNLPLPSPPCVHLWLWALDKQTIGDRPTTMNKQTFWLFSQWISNVILMGIFLEICPFQIFFLTKRNISEFLLINNKRFCNLKLMQGQMIVR
jgi:hypothetical protein